MVGLRMTGAEKKELETVAEYERVSVAELCRRFIIPQVRQRLRERLAAEHAGP